MSEYKTYDTPSTTVYMCRLANDPKVFQRKGDKPGEDVVLSFADNSGIEGHETMWVDARVANFQAERAKKYLKGDIVQIRGKVRYKMQKDGTLRAKIYNAEVESFQSLKDRGAGAGAAAAAGEGAEDLPF